MGLMYLNFNLNVFFFMTSFNYSPLKLTSHNRGSLHIAVMYYAEQNCHPVLSRSILLFAYHPILSELVSSRCFCCLWLWAFWLVAEQFDSVWISSINAILKKSGDWMHCNKLPLLPILFSVVISVQFFIVSCCVQEVHICCLLNIWAHLHINE